MTPADDGWVDVPDASQAAASDGWQDIPDSYQPSDNARAAYQGVMNNVAAPVNSAVSGAMSAATSPIGYAAHPTADAIDSTSAGQWVGDKLMGAKNAVSDAIAPAMDTLHDYESLNPDLEHDLSAFGENANLAGNLAAVKAPLKAITQPGADSFVAARTAQKAAKSALPEMQDALLQSGLTQDQIAKMTPAQIAKAKNALYAKGVAENIQNAQTTKSNIYKAADAVGNDHTMDASETKNALDDLHGQYSTDPQYTGSPLVRKLNSWRQMFNNDGTITPTRLNALKDQVDDAYKESPKSPEGDIYSSIQAPVNGAVSSAKQQFPNWGKLISTADDAHYNMMKYTNEDSTFTGKWSPDSQKDWGITARKGGNLNDLSGDTKNQIAGITNIQNEAQLQQVMSFVPKELQGQFLQDVANNSSSSGGIKSLVKTIYNTAKGNYSQAIANAVKSMPSKSEIEGMEASASTHISDRVQGWKKAAGDAVKAHQAEQMDAEQAAKAGPQGLLPAPPSTTSYVDRAGRSTVPLSPAEKEAMGKGTGTTPHNASSVRDDELLSDYGAVPGKKHGGSVKEPSEAQKHAGNYKKDHLSWHGLGISIENPKGSIRRGVGKDGKKWAVKMPADYGYFKNSVSGDKEHVDVFVGPRLKSNKVWVIDQKHLDTGKWDEHKVMIGFPAKGYALAAYRASFSDGKADQRIQNIAECSIEELKHWLSKTKEKVA